MEIIIERHAKRKVAELLVLANANSDSTQLLEFPEYGDSAVQDAHCWFLVASSLEGGTAALLRYFAKAMRLKLWRSKCPTSSSVAAVQFVTLEEAVAARQKFSFVRRNFWKEPSGYVGDGCVVGTCRIIGYQRSEHVCFERE
jgi:hypothetical protein